MNFLKNIISIRNGIIFISILSFFSCAPSRFVKPLKKGEKAINANFGGPLIGFAGTTIPIPFTSITYGHGLRNDITVFGGMHITSLAYGNFQTEIGMVKEFSKYDSTNKFVPGFSVIPAFNIITDKWENNLKVWPELDLNAYWDINKGKHFIYAGMSNWFELSMQKAHNEKQENHWIFNPHVGISGQTGKWINNFELKFIAPSYSHQNVVVDFKSIGNNGAIGLYYCITRKF